MRTKIAAGAAARSRQGARRALFVGAGTIGVAARHCVCRGGGRSAGGR